MAKTLSGALLILATRLPLCTAEQLAVLADASRGRTRRTLNDLMKANLLMAERDSLVAPKARRFRPTAEGIKLGSQREKRPAGAVVRAYGQDEMSLARVRASLDRVDAARTFFLDWLQKSRRDGTERLRGWRVPAQIEGVALDGLAIVERAEGNQILLLCLDRPALPPHQILRRVHRVVQVAARFQVPPELDVVTQTEERASALRARWLTTVPPTSKVEVRINATGETEAGSPLLIRKMGKPAPGGQVPDSGGAMGLLSLPRGREVAQHVAELRTQLTPMMIRALETLAEHPLLNAADLAVISRSTPRQARSSLTCLMATALIAAGEERPHRYALTRSGVELLAAREGVSTSDYVHLHEIALDAAGQPGWKRLEKYRPHNVGAAAFFLMLLRRAEWRRPQGHHDRLAAWEGPVRCQRRFQLNGRWRSLRPDGFGVYIADGLAFPFHLEWDRGTLRPDQQERKLLAYRAYGEALEWAHDRAACPMLLCVFPDPGTEHRTLRLAEELFEGVTDLTMLTTVRALLTRYGPAAPIWRDPFQQGGQRWLTPAQPAETAA